MTVPQQRLLGHRYALAQTIGIGGMAEVFLGTDTRLGREVAVKVLRADLARDPSFHSRFRREAQSAASLNAPCIVAVYDSGEDLVDGSQAVPWIVMEHVPGRTLREVLTEDGPLPAQRALQIVADVCAALQVAHAAGIVHRDVKPGNVMLTPAGDVKVMDFGIARAAAASSLTMTETAAVIGTAAYLSPEQARGEQVDARSDLYSAGCLLYELLTGRAPFTGDSPLSIAYQHVREEPLPPSHHRPELDAAVDAVVLTALAKHPDARYPSAEAMREDLVRAAAGEPVAAVLPRNAPVVAVTDGRRRTPVWALLAVLLLALAAAVALLLPGLLDRSQPVAMPALVGLAETDAKNQLLGAGLAVGTVSRRFSDQPVGDVLAQSPQPGLPVAAATAVDLVVSRGPELVTVPDVVGVAQDEAEVRLEQVRLAVRDVLERGANSPPGDVLEVIPEAGTEVPVGGEVTLVVSSGRIEVPLVVNRSRTDAVRILQRAGFEVTVETAPSSGRSGVVLSQDPVNRSAARGSEVTIVVSVARATSQPRPSRSATEPSSPRPRPSATPTSTPRPRPSATRTPTRPPPTTPPPPTTTSPPPPTPSGTPGPAAESPAPADRGEAEQPQAARAVPRPAQE